MLYTNDSNYYPVKHLVAGMLVCIVGMAAWGTVYAKNTKNAKTDRSRYNKIVGKNIFRPLWKSSQTSDDSAEKERKKQEEERKKQEERSRLEQQKLMEDMRLQNEARAIEAKKRDIEGKLTLTGIVFDGHSIVALIKNNRHADKTLMLKKGDSVEECTITSIDENNGIVTLDYTNRCTIKLNLQGNADES